MLAPCSPWGMGHCPPAPASACPPWLHPVGGGAQWLLKLEHSTHICHTRITKVSVLSVSVRALILLSGAYGMFVGNKRKMSNYTCTLGNKTSPGINQAKPKGTQGTKLTGIRFLLSQTVRPQSYEEAVLLEMRQTSESRLHVCTDVYVRLYVCI